MVKTYVINLEKDLAKRERMAALADRHGLPISFHKAVYGWDLGVDVIQRVADAQLRLASSGRLLTPGEIGCALSHLQVLSLIKPGEVFLILEDDVSFDARLPDFLARLHELPSGWEVVLLGHQVDRCRATRLSLWGRQRVGGHWLGKPVEQAWGAYGYLINHFGAKRLLGLADPVVMPMDHYTGSTRCVNLYALSVPIVDYRTEMLGASNLEQQREVPVRFEGGTRRFLRRLPFFSAANLVRRRVLAALGLLQVFRKVSSY